MFHYHFLEENKHSEFLSQNRIDPITGDKIQEGDCIVICAACKSAFLEESWNYLRQQHCNQYGTLNKIPKTEKIYFKGEPLVFLPFNVRNEESFLNEFLCKFLQSSTTAFLILLPLFLAILACIFIPFDDEGFRYAFSFVIMPFCMMIFYVIVSIFSLTRKTFFRQIINQKNRFFIQKLRQSYLIGNYFAINLKNKSIVTKTELGEKEILFSSIEKIVHSYYADKIFNKNGFLLLQIRIATNKEIINYESIFEEVEKNKVDIFLNKLPQNLKTFERNNIPTYY